FNKEEIEKLGMEALLAVSRGSNKEPRFVVLKYFGNNKTSKHTTFVGKGVTYDSGGYAIKPAGSMASMKSDMGGSAAVVGAFRAIALNALKVNVVGVMALTENMINGEAFKNGDVISSMKKTTIEVVNTDAEGRLTLADSIYYAATKLESEEIIELATLTGACVVALGTNITGITTKNDELYEKIHEIGLKTDEFNWRMPITKELSNSIKSDIADIKNSVSGGGGMMTAGIFLDHFAEDIPFIHLDIAGTAFGTSNKNAPNGATGMGVKTLYEFIKEKQ
ncbi:MAG TPA: leucyl aminopeptidase, partial [Acholeplasmataceae bacterium]|nr:leucyl aminopeptidase [Acholeplasmataceae bacterium]